MTDENDLQGKGTIDQRLLLSILRDVRKDQRETKQLVVDLMQAILNAEKRMDRRFEQFREDIEMLVKSETMGRLTHFETRIDDKIEELLQGSRV